MANYYCMSRTNYFQVKDEKAFVDWAVSMGFQTSKSHLGKGYALFPSPHDDAGSFESYDEEKDDWVDIAAEISKHLAEGQVAVIVEAGSEKSRYAIGRAEAIDWRGKRVGVSIDDIYNKAKRAFKVQEITEASY